MNSTHLITILAASVLITATASAVPLQLNHQGRLLDSNSVNLDGPAHFKFAIVDGGVNLNETATATISIRNGAVFRVTILNSGFGYESPPRVIIDPPARGTRAEGVAVLTGNRVSAVMITEPGDGYLRAPRITLGPPTAPTVFTTFWSHDGTSTAGEMPHTSLTLPLTKGLFSVRLGDTTLPGMNQPLAAADLEGDSGRFLRTWVSDSGDPGTFEQLSPDHKFTSVPYAILAETAFKVPDGSIGMDQIANGAITGDKIAVNTITNNNIAAPGNEKILVSDGNGNAVWMTAAEFLLSQGYTPTLPGIVENLCPIEIEGVMSETVQIVNGPGLQIEDLGGNPGESGLNSEFAIVFDYDGPANQDLQDWLATPTPKTGSIIVEDAAGTEFFRWDFFDYELTSIGVGGGNNGKNRYTLTHTQVPNNTVSIQRTNGDWPANPDKRPGDTKVEIEGVIFDVWPVVVDDPVAKTLTMTFDYNEGGGIWEWARQIAQDGTFNRGRKALSLIYEDNRGLEIGRNNYFECFPIRYQHFTGFDLVTKGKEQVVISYDFAQNADNGNDPLFVPPVIEYSPGTPLMAVPYNLATNELAWEIDGVQTNQVIAPGEVPVLLSGPGWEIERIAGFDGQGNPDDQSGSTREFPLVVEVGGPDLVELTAWRNDYVLSLPLNAVPKALSLVVKDASDTETFRWNCFEMIPFDVTLLPSGRGRVTIYHNRPPDNIVWYEFNDPQDWPDALQNNPATDTEVEIEGITTVFAEVAVDPATRTLTLTFDFGEGGSIIGWATGIGEMGTSTLGKKSVHLADGGLGTNYLGCFPIAFQHFTGFEQDLKGKAKVVLSYDTTAPATQ